MSSVYASGDLSRSAAASDIGRVRSENQDTILADDQLGLWLVADGMGGHAGGARASSLARDVVKMRIEQGGSLDEAVAAAHQAICEEQRQRPELSEMGTTIVVAAEDRHSRGVDIRWVGDSRAYCYSCRAGELKLLTSDHNLAGLLVEVGKLSPTEAARHPQRHVLTDCLGQAGGAQPRVGAVHCDWQPGDLLLLCSDGLTSELGDEDVSRSLAAEATLAGATAALMQEVLAAGARDNVSLVLVAAPGSSVGDGSGHRPPSGRG